MKTTTNKNMDMELFRQLKKIDFEYLVQLSALIAENVETNGADCLEEEMVTFDITLDNVIKERIRELCNSEKKVKEILSEDVSNDHDLIKEINEEDRSYYTSLEAKNYISYISNEFDIREVIRQSKYIADVVVKNNLDINDLFVVDFCDTNNNVYIILQNDEDEDVCKEALWIGKIVENKEELEFMGNRESIDTYFNNILENKNYSDEDKIYGIKDLKDYINKELYIEDAVDEDDNTLSAIIDKDNNIVHKIYY
ncbi:hypothetical protein DWV12_11195 [Clostridium botulinum]|uniref:hypothetical protein n=1 Tax=Clostridium botulinum TaxID=1491 RepID=UPI00217E6FAB|nr:hypothetical protein [Clostridium botulinum]MCS6107936.1 hypothetical protein [Clostridium botulinum]